MKNISLYIKWLGISFTELYKRENIRWFIFYAIFSVTGFFGLHLIYLKKFKRFILYVIPWAILVGSYVATYYRPVPFLIFFIGLALLAVVFLIDIFNVYLVQPYRLNAYLPLILLLLFFCVQVFLYEFIAQDNTDLINQKVLSIAARFSGINN